MNESGKSMNNDTKQNFVNDDQIYKSKAIQE